MRLKINKRLKVVLLCISSILIIAFLMLIYKEIKIPGYKEEQIPVFTYKQKGDIQYEVYLKPNILYEQPSLGEGNIYITEFVDTIEASFSYAFDGERISGIRGECEIIATVEGFSDLSANEKSNASGDTKTIWKKEYILWPKTITQVQKKSDSFSKKVSIPFNEYKNFSNEVQTLSRVSLSTRLLVTMNTTLTAETDQGPIIEANSQALIIPLDENSFEIRKVILGEPEGAILETVQVPVNHQSRVQIYSICAGIMAAFVLFLAFLTAGTEGKSQHIRELNKILKKHGSRLVAINGDVAAGCTNQCSVHSMEDLVKLADEVGKPVIYKFDEQPEKITQFYVFSDLWMYCFNMKDYTGRQGKNHERSNGYKTGKQKSDFKARVKPVPAEPAMASSEGVNE